MSDLIKMVSTGTLDGKPTGEYFVTTKNKKTKAEKLVLKRYDKRLRKHVKFVETKM
jgi:large subunit ribosomal protein L33